MSSSFNRWRPHPWHGIDVGPQPPKIVHAYIESTPFHHIQYEVDNQTGYLRVDRPHRTSSLPPTLYGFIPQTYCGKRVGEIMPGASQGDEPSSAPREDAPAAEDASAPLGVDASEDELPLMPEVEDPGEWCDREFSAKAIDVESWETLRHSFSHYDLDIQPIVVRVASPLSRVADSGDAMWHRLGDKLPGGVAAPVNKLLEKLQNVSHN